MQLPRHQNPVPWILVVILIALLCVAVAAIAWLLTQQQSATAQKPVTLVVPATQLPQAASANAVQPSPLPTYTPYATYTPFPTVTPQVVIATRAPIIVTPTSSSEDQNPAPGSVIAAGQGFTKNGITVSLKKELQVNNSFFGYTFSFDGLSGRLDPSVKYLIFTLDQLVGMSNMNWRYDLQ